MTIKGLRSGSLKVLTPVLRQWQKIMDVQFWNYKNDALWWYNERTLLSLFAGAVWSCGGWALEEFATSKKFKTNRGKLKNYNGRGDLWFGIKKYEFVAEAKQCWPILNSKINIALKSIRESLNRARIDSSRLPSYGKKLAITFIVPRVHKTNSKLIDDLLRNFEKELHKFERSAMAWLFPDKKRHLSGKDHFLYPGIVLLIRSLKS